MSFPKSFSFSNFSTFYHFSILFVSLLYLLLSLSFTDSNRRYQIWSYKICTWRLIVSSATTGPFRDCPDHPRNWGNHMSTMSAWTQVTCSEPHVYRGEMVGYAPPPGEHLYLTVVCRIPTGWFNRIRKSLILLFRNLVGDPHRIFRFHQRHALQASTWIRKRRSGSKCWQKLQFLGGTWHGAILFGHTLQLFCRSEVVAKALDVSTSDFWFFAASRDLTLRLGMLLLGWFCRLFPAIFGWCASWSKFLTLVDIYLYIYTISSKNELPHPSLPFQTQPTNRTFNCKANHLMSIATALTQLPQTDLQALTTDLGRSCQRFEMIDFIGSQ